MEGLGACLGHHPILAIENARLQAMGTETDPAECELRGGAFDGNAVVIDQDHQSVVIARKRIEEKADAKVAAFLNECLVRAWLHDFKGGIDPEKGGVRIGLCGFSVCVFSGAQRGSRDAKRAAVGAGLIGIMCLSCLIDPMVDRCAGGGAEDDHEKERKLSRHDLKHSQDKTCAQAR